MRPLSTQLREFHEVFEIVVDSPHHLTCIKEETAELLEEIDHHICGRANSTQVAKEGIDVVYTIVSLFVARGWDFEAAFEEVHRSNMSKLDLERRPIRRRDGKVLKGPHYSPADLTAAIGGKPEDKDQRIVSLENLGKLARSANRELRKSEAARESLITELRSQIKSLKFGAVRDSSLIEALSISAEEWQSKVDKQSEVREGRSLLLRDGSLLRSIGAAMMEDFPTCSLDRFDKIAQRVLTTVREDTTSQPVEAPESLPTSLGPRTLKYVKDALTPRGGR